MNLIVRNINKKGFFVFIVLMIIILFISCNKEDEYISANYRKSYPLEGNYKGTRTLICDSLHMDVEVNLELTIRAKTGEVLYIENNEIIVAKAQFNKLVYYYQPFLFDYDPDCPLVHTVTIYGSGNLDNDTIREQGWFIIQNKRGTWKSTLIKTK